MSTIILDRERLNSIYKALNSITRQHHSPDSRIMRREYEKLANIYVDYDIERIESLIHQLDLRTSIRGDGKSHSLSQQEYELDRELVAEVSRYVQ